MRAGTGWRRSSFSCATMVLVMSGCMVAWGNEKMFITKFNNRLRDCFCQRWFSYLAKVNDLTCTAAPKEFSFGG